MIYPFVNGNIRGEYVGSTYTRHTFHWPLKFTIFCKIVSFFLFLPLKLPLFHSTSDHSPVPLLIFLTLTLSSPTIFSLFLSPLFHQKNQNNSTTEMFHIVFASLVWYNVLTSSTLITPKFPIFSQKKNSLGFFSAFGFR